MSKPFREERAIQQFGRLAQSLVPRTQPLKKHALMESEGQTKWDCMGTRRLGHMSFLRLIFLAALIFFGSEV
jgi:hypothetical protein